jgi:hypothetical protein
MNVLGVIGPRILGHLQLGAKNGGSELHQQLFLDIDLIGKGFGNGPVEAAPMTAGMALMPISA